VPLGRPNQGILPQRAQARAPGANGGSDGLAAATAGADAIVVETIDAKVYTATAWTPWLRFFYCWPVGVRREEGLL